MSVHVERLPVAPGLGRHVRHDSRSLAYAVGVLPKGAIVSQHWQRRVPIFDQGQVGSCTGNAAAGWVGTDDATRQGLADLTDGTPVDEKLALSIYSAAEVLDGDGPYPPKDNGSSGLSVSKVLQTRGLAVSYIHGFSVAAVASALQFGPGLLGIPWFNSMFDTDADGHIKVDTSSGLAGGHELVAPRIDVPSSGVVERFWVTNSWRSSWGVGGSGYFTLAELTELLANQGDFTVPTAPVVAPPMDADAQLWASTATWRAARHTLSNKAAAADLAAWGKAKGLAVS